MILKKVFIILLTVVQLLTLVSCGQSEKDIANADLMATTVAPAIEAAPSETDPGTSREELSEEVAPTETEEATKETTEAVPSESETEALPTTEAGIESTTEKSTQPTTEAPTEPPHQHSYTASPVAASCESQGYTLYTCSCGKSYSEGSTAPLGHSYTDTVVEPTSTAQGYTEHVCSHCGNSYKDNYTAPVKITYSTAEAQQVGNNYIASLGYAVDSSLVWADVHGYYPPELITGYELGIVGGQEWLNNSTIGNVQATVDSLIATTNPNDDVTKARLYCSVTYDEASDTYTICVYYG